MKAESTRRGRRLLLKGMGLLSLGLGGGLGGLPSRAYGQSREIPVWRIQTSWGEGTLGYDLFRNFCDSVVERTQGLLALEAVPAGAVRNDLQFYDALRIGALEGINVFSVYWAGRFPAGVFMSSYPGGLSYPSHWDVMLDSYGGRKVLEGIYDRLGLHFVGHVHHDMNILHSVKPLRTLKDFEGLTVRVPGHLIGDSFKALGSRPVLLPGRDIVEALGEGVIEAADYVGPSLNVRLGLHKEAGYVILGPLSSPSINQPVDVMDIAVSKKAWLEVKPSVRELFRALVSDYSRTHYAAIQEANREAWEEISLSGVEVVRLSEGDMRSFRRKLLPLWFSYAKKDKESMNLFKVHLEVMRSESVGLLSDKDVEGYRL